MCSLIDEHDSDISDNSVDSDDSDDSGDSEDSGDSGDSDASGGMNVNLGVWERYAGFLNHIQSYRRQIMTNNAANARSLVFLQEQEDMIDQSRLRGNLRRRIMETPPTSPR